MRSRTPSPSSSPPPRGYEVTDKKKEEEMLNKLDVSPAPKHSTSRIVTNLAEEARRVQACEMRIMLREADKAEEKAKQRELTQGNRNPFNGDNLIDGILEVEEGLLSRWSDVITNQDDVELYKQLSAAYCQAKDSVLPYNEDRERAFYLLLKNKLMTSEQFEESKKHMLDLQGRCFAAPDSPSPRPR